MPTGVYIRTEEYRKKIGEAMKLAYLRGTKKPPLLGTTHTEEYKKYMSEVMKKKVLPQRFLKGHIPYNKGKPHLQGEKHGMWKGGIDLENERLRHSDKWINWRNEVYKRDFYTCKMCKKHCGKDIVAHHIKLFSKFKELRFDVNNGMTLCRSCHAKIHQKNKKQ